MIGVIFSIFLASVGLATLAVRIYDSIFYEVNTATSAARSVLFTGTWASVTTALGMRKYTKTVRGLHQKSLGVQKKIDAITRVRHRK